MKTAALTFIVLALAACAGPVVEHRNPEPQEPRAVWKPHPIDRDLDGDGVWDAPQGVDRDTDNDGKWDR